MTRLLRVLWAIYICIHPTMSTPNTLDEAPSFGDLPVELVEQLLYTTVEMHPTLYPMLLCVSRLFHQMVRLKLVHLVPVRITTTARTLSFLACIRGHPEIALRIRWLWAVFRKGEGRTDRVPAIIAACSNVESLACYPTTLMIAMNEYREYTSPQQEFVHTRCVNLTLVHAGGHLVPWDTLLKGHVGRLFSQLQRLRLAVHPVHSQAILGIGSLPRMDNLRELSFRARTLDSLVRRAVQALCLSQPILRAVVITTTVPPSTDTRIAETTDAMAWNSDTSSQGHATVHVVSLASPRWFSELDVWYDQACGRRSMLEIAEEELAEFLEMKEALEQEEARV